MVISDRRGPRIPDIKEGLFDMLPWMLPSHVMIPYSLSRTDISGKHVLALVA
jgi:hypothetical protein